MRSSRPRVLSIDEQERYSQYAEYQPYRPPTQKPGMHMDPLWLGLTILGCCAFWAFVYVWRYRPPTQKPGMHMDPLWLGIAILAGCALWAFGYVAFFQWR